MDVWPQNDFKLKMHTIKHLIKIFSTFLDTWETLRTLIRFEDPYNVPIKLMEILFKIYLNSRTRVTSGIKGQFKLILIVHRFPCSMLVCLFSYNPLCLFFCLDSILSNSIYLYAGRAMMPIEYLVLVLILKSASFHDACHSTCYMWRLFVMSLPGPFLYNHYERRDWHMELCDHIYDSFITSSLHNFLSSILYLFNVSIYYVSRMLSVLSLCQCRCVCLPSSVSL